MPSKKNNILEFNQYMNSGKMPNIIYADIKSLIKKIDGCANNPEKSSTKELGEHIPCRYLISIIWAFDIYGKQAYFISWGRLYEKVLYFFKRTCYKCN